jgi:hypothetical protein
VVMSAKFAGCISGRNTADCGMRGNFIRLSEADIVSHVILDRLSNDDFTDSRISLKRK